MSNQAHGILDRTLGRFVRAWRSPARSGRRLRQAVSAELTEVDIDRLRPHIDACLQARGGEVSARERAAELGETYLVLSASGRRRFLQLLADEYDVDAAAVDAAIEDRATATSATERAAAERALRAALVPPRVRLLRQFNALEQGVKFLVDLRAELMDIARNAPELAPLDEDLHEMLAGWFDVGFLDLARITWNTPAALLEKLIEYEAVHAIRSWEDLKNRLEADRRCYAYFHPRMPHEPLIFVQVALVDGMADNIQTLLDESKPISDPEQADSAIFYSISNCQRGLAGVSFGSFLIKRVAQHLVRDLPNLKTFATLSPLPGFRRWLYGALADRDRSPLSDGEITQIAALAPESERHLALAALLETDDWWRDGATAAILEPILMRLAAVYLVRERRDDRALDRVAHFHLSNGARVERINWLGDTSENGLRQSAGMMVNYRYELSTVEPNHEAYSGEGRVAAAPGVLRLLKT